MTIPDLTLKDIAAIRPRTQNKDTDELPAKLSTPTVLSMKRDFFRPTAMSSGAASVVNSLSRTLTSVLTCRIASSSSGALILPLLLLCTPSPLQAATPDAAGVVVEPALAPKPAPKTPQSLRDAFQAALKRSETVDIQRELYVQAKEGVRQGWGALAPTISGSWSTMHQEFPHAADNEAGFIANQSTTKLTLDQPLFRGLRDIATIRQKKALQSAQVFALKAASFQLFSDLTTAYYNVVAYQSDERNYLSEIETNQKHLNELRHFLRIGRSRQTDLLTFQSNISSLEAQVEVTRGNLETAKDTLAYLTGWDRETPLKDLEMPRLTPDVQSLLARIDERPDVKSALDNASAYTQGVPIARGYHFPNLDLIGDYYIDRPGISGGPDWDVQLSLSVPIFQGGVVNSEVRQAQSIAVQYELSLSQTRRQAEQTIRTLFDAYQADLKQVAKYEENVLWSKKNYEAEIHDYRLGLVTNLDVLSSITTYEDAQRLLDHTRVQAKSDGARLEGAAALRPELDIDVKKTN